MQNQPQIQKQLRPPEGGRYKFKSKTNCNGWRSEDRRYKFNGECRTR
jgi:hypothetical protein